MSLGGGRLFEGWLRRNHSPGLLLRLIAKPLQTPPTMPLHHLIATVGSIANQNGKL